MKKKSLKTRTQHDKIRLRLPDSRTRENRRFEQSHRPSAPAAVIATPLRVRRLVLVQNPD